MQKLGQLALVLLCAALWGCGPHTGEILYWSRGEYPRAAGASQLRVIHLTYDASTNRVLSPEPLAPHDTIGIITHEIEKDPFISCSRCMARRTPQEYWDYDEKAVRLIQRKAWEMGGEALLLASPKMQHRGVQRTISQYALSLTLANDSATLGQMERKGVIDNPWISYCALVIRWRAAHP